MKRFLISRLSSLGDVVCTLPVAGALKAGFPDSEIVWAVDPRFKAIVQSCKHVDQVQTFKPGLSPNTWPSIPGEFDAALDLQGLFKSAIIVGKTSAAEKVGYHWQREGSWLFSNGIRPDPTSMHIVDQYVDVARSIGGVAERADFGLQPLADASQSLRAKFHSDRYIAINPGAGWESKRWGVEHIAALCEQVVEKEIDVALIGSSSAEEKSIAESILCKLSQGAVSKVIPMAGQTSIAELIALISGASAHVGGDTGSTHVAAALNVPAVGLYSITKPIRSCPYGQIDRCLFDPRGLNYISPEAVGSVVLEAVKL